MRSGAQRCLPIPPQPTVTAVVPSLPSGLWFCQKVIKLSHISVGKKHHRKDCKVFRNSQNSFISLKKSLSSSWVPGLAPALSSWGEQNQTGCCLVEETQMITKKWNDNCDSQPETTWRTHQTQTGIQGKDLSGDHVQAEIRYRKCWLAWMCVCVCVCNSGPEGTSEPGPVVGRGPGAGNMVWLRGASSCRGSAREGGVSWWNLLPKSLGGGAERRFGERVKNLWR